MVNDMNETIGVKGGKRDFKRTIIITKNKKKKLQEYYHKKQNLNLKKLEQEVKQLQISSFLVAVPIAIAGNTLETILHLRDNNKTEREEAKGLSIEELHQQNKLELKETALYIEDYQTNDRKFTDYGYPKTTDGKEIVKYRSSKVLDNITKVSYPTEATARIPLEQDIKEKKTLKQEDSKRKVEIKTVNQTEIALQKTAIEELPDTLLKLTDKKIVSQYEESLKEIKGELKNIIYEFTILENTTSEIYNSKKAEQVLDQLIIIIKKLEELKEKIKLELTTLEDDTYLTYLVDNYIEDFKNNKTVDGVKDSGLYIMLSDKIEEAKTTTQNLNNHILEEKEKLELDEAKFSLLKESYYDFENFNNQLLLFQNEQDQILKDLEQKVKESTTITEQVEYKMKAMSRQSKRLLKMLTLPMLIPGNRSAKAMATGTAAYLYFLHNLLNPKLERKKYRIIKVTDYSKDIENNIAKIEETTNLLTKTSTKLKDMIEKIEIDFKDYIKEIPEYKELLNNLNSLLNNLKEKEEELARIKKNQEKVLEENNQKVKTLEQREEV